MLRRIAAEEKIKADELKSLTEEKSKIMDDVSESLKKYVITE